MPVFYFTEDTKFAFKGKKKTTALIRKILKNENFTEGNISVIFCSDSILLGMNVEFLKHDYYTDIITFNYVENRTISGDLYISVNRVRENSANYQCSVLNEMQRVIVHGVLHLIGYDDQTPEAAKIIRSKEDYYLNF